MLPPVEFSLSQLLPGLQRGDPAARNAVLACCQDRLKKLTRRMLRDYPGVRRWEDTSDVFQMVLLRLDKALRELRFKTPDDFLKLAAWHIRCQLLDVTRRPPPLEPVPEPPEPTDTTNNPTRLAVWREVHEYIAALPDEDRVLFDLLFYCGLTQPEAAARLGVSIRTVRRRWQAARERLVLALGNEVPF
jgi:RNA polymerase sigma-70 factor (ECF subfamily)